MGIGFVKVTPDLLRAVLQFPNDWIIEAIETTEENDNTLFLFIISGDDFPKEKADGTIAACQLKGGKHPRLTWKVKEV